jgi:hypothetical protein
MKTYKVSRRDALRMLGMAGVASTLPGPGLGLNRAQAQSAQIPKRIIFFYTNHGTLRQSWLPKGVGTSPATETAFELNDILVPLQAYKKDLLIIDGLDMLSSDKQTGAAKNAHIRGHCHSLVAADMAGADQAGGISIDQHIAKALNSPSPITPISSLEIGIDPNVESLISYAAASQKLPIEMDPKKAFTRLFPTGSAPGSMATSDKTPAQQRSVLDFVLGEFNAVKGKLDPNARARVESHADAVRDLETRLGIAVQRTCTAPQLAAAANRNSDYAGYYDTTADNFMRVIQAAFACDMTRVVTFNLEAIPDKRCGYTAGAAGSTDMHDLIHKVAMPNDAASKDATALGIVKSFHTEYAKQFSKLLGYLSSMQEADGQTMLDHTIVLWCGEIAEGNHDLHRLPWLIAGQGGGSVRTGRFLTVPRSPSARGHNDLFVSLANAMGSNITAFGNPAACKGPITLT